MPGTKLAKSLPGTKTAKSEKSLTHKTIGELASQMRLACQLPRTGSKASCPGWLGPGLRFNNLCVHRRSNTVANRTYAPEERDVTHNKSLPHVAPDGARGKGWVTFAYKHAAPPEHVYFWLVLPLFSPRMLCVRCILVISVSQANDLYNVFDGKKKQHNDGHCPAPEK